MGVVNEQEDRLDTLETPTYLGSTMAGDDVQDKLRCKLIAKRVLEGQEIPEDLFAKKPRYSMSDEEVKRSEERRRRNKEAAEKSRRKKKEEFEKLQQENDQLNQDKCELAAMIAKQKTDIDALNVKNFKLKQQVEQLCRYMATRAKEFGLDKHMGKQQQSVIIDHDSSHPILRDDRDPTLHHRAVKPRRVSEDGLARRSPDSFAGSPPPSQEHRMLMRVTTKQLQTPWLVEQAATTKPVEVKEEQPHDDQDVMIVDAEEEQQMVVEEHILYLPKDTVLFVQDGSGNQVTAVETGEDAEDEEIEDTKNGAEEDGGETITQAEAVSNDEGNSSVPESEAVQSAASETKSTSAAAAVSSAPTAQETVVSTTTTTSAAGSQPVSREALLTFVEALIKAGVKFDTTTLPSLLNKPSDTKLNAVDDHNYLPATPPKSPQKSNRNILLAH